jgi:hypothetical protein
VNASRKIVAVVKFEIFLKMKKYSVLLLLLLFVTNSCGALMSSNSKKDNSNNLPPNVSSNKYSKKRN